MDARKNSHVIVKGTEVEWEEVLGDLTEMEEEFGEVGPSTKYLIIALKNALK